MFTCAYHSTGDLLLVVVWGLGLC
eukprot:COSAG02_NODE_18046_length_964_cov_1.337572_1_plen_23_part_10